MQNADREAATVAGSAALPFVLSTGGVMGLRPTQGDESGSCSATTVAGSTALPFVISTGAQRSGEICGVSGPSLGRRSQGDETGPVQQRLLLEAPPSPLSSRPERSVVERSAVSALLPWAGEVKAMKRVLFSNDCSWKRSPPPLSSRPERSVVERSAVSAVLPWAGEVKAMKNGSCSATTVAGSAALPFVISTGAQRSGEICGVSGPSLGRRSQGEEKRVLFSNDCCWKHRTPLCHLDRSAA